MFKRLHLEVVDVIASGDRRGEESNERAGSRNICTAAAMPSTGLAHESDGEAAVPWYYG